MLKSSPGRVRHARTAGRLLAGLLALAPLAAHCADDDALALEADAPAAAAGSAGPAARPESGMRLFVEAAAGISEQRHGQSNRGQGRLSVDYSQIWRLTPQARAVLSNRLDLADPQGANGHTATNTLREAYFSWQGQGGDWVIDAGRVILRNGPSYGFNPTDFFRRGALRTLTSPDPLALRENRQGTVMLRAQTLWDNGALSVALAPDLADTPSTDSVSLDLGSTNAEARLLATWSQRWSERMSSQALWLAEAGQSPRLGASATALVGDNLVGFAEWAGGRRADHLATALGRPGQRAWRSQWALGATWSLPAELSLTLEFDHNGLAARRSALAAGPAPAAYGAYLQTTQFEQDSASRRAWMLYATRKNLLIKDLDLTALLRRNQDDASWFAWVELRHHWPRADLALQLQGSRGAAFSEYGAMPARASVQLLGAWFF